MGIDQPREDIMKPSSNAQDTFATQVKYGMFKRSVIDEEQIGEDEESEFGDVAHSMSGKSSIMRKRAIRNTWKGDFFMNRTEISKNEFGQWLQKSLIAVFEGCHKDAMKSTLSLRSILYKVKIAKSNYPLEHHSNP